MVQLVTDSTEARVRRRFGTQAEVRTSLSPLYEVISSSSGPAVDFIRSRVGRMSERWTRAALRMRQSSNETFPTQMRV